MATNQQLHFTWGGSAANDPSRVLLEAPLPTAQPDTTGEELFPRTSVQSVELPWDFTTTFPLPLPNAVAAGKLGEEEVTPEQNASMHEEHAAELLTLLEQFKAVEDAKQTGVDPRSGTRPRTIQTRERLGRYLESAPAEIMQNFNGLMDVYEDAYGSEAAEAFKQAIQARFNNIPIRVTVPEGRVGNALSDETVPLTPPIVDSDVTGDMPIAAPLPEAVERKAFGEDEFGPIDPSVEEVEALTGHIVLRMHETLDRLEELDDALSSDKGLPRDSLVREKDCAWSAFQSAMALYQEDFGEDAGRRLENWVRSNRTQTAAQYGPGHPWHYYREGDAQPPLPVEQIEPGHVGDTWMGKLPQDWKKRTEKLRLILAD